MPWKVEVRYRQGIYDAEAHSKAGEMREAGVKVERVEIIWVYRLDGKMGPDEAGRIARELLADPVTQEYRVGKDAPELWETPEGALSVEVAYNPGVMDPAEGSIKKAIGDMGICVDTVRTAKRYILWGASEEDLDLLADGVLANPLIQHLVVGGEALRPPEEPWKFERTEVPIREASDEELMKISKERLLSLSLEEMRAIREHFRRTGREPTDVELETLAQTWSEHCVHKTFKGRIIYEGRKIENLLKSTIMKVTEELAKPWCLSVFVDNAGVIAFDEDWAVCFKVETHNHPSALEPYGGAGTGIGGVIRDVLGTGLGAKPILNTDVFCFGPLDLPREKLPKGTLHPRQIFRGVVAGVRDYGNRMGIPTVNGAVCFDEGFTFNPLVYCGTVGIMPRDKVKKDIRPGDLIVLVGGRTGRDGIHGATFSSDALSEGIPGGVVQIGNPITEKKLADVLLKARDRGLYRAITDCGGGGLSSAAGEMGREVGILVDLDRVPLKYEGLSYTEIWISEAQERMLLAVPPENLEELLELFSREDVEATVIGKFTGDGRLRLRYRGKPVADLDMNFLHKGLPLPERKAEWTPPTYPEPDFPPPKDLTDALVGVLSRPNVCSKEWIIRQYDHEVQGGSVLKPLVGAENDGPGDAAVVRPVPSSKKGIAVANGICPKFGRIDPYWMAASAVDEALRQIVAVGGNLERTALLDNFCWGTPEDPQQLGGLVRAASACYDFAKLYGTPFISGKDSLNNDYLLDGRRVSIPPTLLISALSVVEDVGKVVSMDLKRPGDLVYIVGATYRELGGSEYWGLMGHLGNSVPKVRPEGRQVLRAVSRAISEGLVRACHDLSDGGLGVASAEMAFSGGLGLKLDLRNVPREGVERDDEILFSESNSRFLVEVAPEQGGKLERLLSGVPFALVGQVTDDDEFVVVGLEGEEVVRTSLGTLKEAWQAPLREV